jgi:hypothetical protein
MHCEKLLSLLVVLFLSGSLVSNSHAETSEDAWYRGVSTEVRDLAGWLLVDDQNIHEVVDSMQGFSQTLLETTPYVKLDYDQAKKLLGRPLPNMPGTEPYLIRSVYFYKESGSYYVATLDGNLWVSHASLGHTLPPMTRRVLVIQLKQKPEEVYVTASMAE